MNSTLFEIFLTFVTFDQFNAPYLLTYFKRKKIMLNQNFWTG